VHGSSEIGGVIKSREPAGVLTPCRWRLLGAGAAKGNDTFCVPVWVKRNVMHDRCSLPGTASAPAGCGDDRTARARFLDVLKNAC
jgi:hypothetical protein